MLRFCKSLPEEDYWNFGSHFENKPSPLLMEEWNWQWLELSAIMKIGLSRMTCNGNDNRKHPLIKENPSPIRSSAEYVMLCVWWDIKCDIYHEMLNGNEAFNAEIYCFQLKTLYKNTGKTNAHFYGNKIPHISQVIYENIIALLMNHSLFPDITPFVWHLCLLLPYF